MSASDRFRFRATDVFGLFGRGLVFRGSVITGEISVGAMVAIAGRSREHQARVAAIEINRNLIETSKHGVELGLLLADFKDPMIQRILCVDRMP